MNKPKFSKKEAQDAVKWIRTSPACSYWLKDALEKSLNRDPVDAWKDAALLESILDVTTKEPLS